MADVPSKVAQSAYDGSTPVPRRNVGGRPRKEPPPYTPRVWQDHLPDDAVKLIQDLAKDGWTKVGIAEKLGVSHEKFLDWLREHPELQHAIDRGREHERHALHNRLFRIAMEEEPRYAILAAQTLLNSRHGYRQEPSEKGSSPNVTIVMPAARPLGEYIEVANADRSEVKRIPIEHGKGT